MMRASNVLLGARRCARDKHGLALHVRFLAFLTGFAPRTALTSGTITEDRKRFDAEFRSQSIQCDIYSCNLRISAFGRRGDINRARAVFDQMPHRDVVTYASMIDLYLKTGDLQQAEALFRVIPVRNVVTDSAMIHGLANAGRIDEARRIFDQMPIRNVFTWTILLSGYWRVGDVSAARRVFDEMPEKNVISWTTMLQGYARNGLLLEARHLFDQIPERNTVAWTAMIKAYVDEGEMQEANQLFDEMPQRNMYSCNIMIQGFLHCKQISKAFNLFYSMPHKNAVSWTTIVSGLAANGMIESARNMFDQMPEKDIAAWNAMITAYANNAQMDMATELFESMREKNMVTWNAMIDGYAKNESHTKALSIFLRMLRSLIKPNEASLTCLLGACDSMITGTAVHAFATKLAFERKTCFTNALVTTYSRNGDLRAAWLSFDELKAKDTVSWSSMISAFSNHGYGRFALTVFAKMLGYGAQPDGITFVGLLSACNHAGLVAKGRKIFDSMTRAYSVEPKAEHRSCLIDMMGRSGRVDEAYALLGQVPRSERDAAVLGALLGACKAHGHIDIANRIADDLIALEPSTAGTFVSLASIYAAKGEWSDVARMRRRMRERGAEKVPGFSEIEVNMRRHIFFVADRDHSQQEEVYTMLEDLLLPQMRGIECKEELL